MDIIKRKNAIEIPIEGKLDMESARKFEQQILPLFDSSPVDIFGFNMGRLKFLDSSGLSILMKITSQASASGKQILYISLSPMVLGVMKVARLDNVFQFITEEDFNRRYPLA